MTGPSIGKVYLLSGKWTPERDALLKSIVESGAPFAEAARQLGCSKNAALGRAHRLGFKQPSGAGERNNRLASRAYKSGVAMEPRAKPKPAKPKLIVCGNNTVLEKPEGHAPKTPESFNPKAWEPLPGTEPVTIMGLRSSSCRWPVDLQGAAEQHYCNGLAFDGRYCTTHAKLAARPLPQKDRTEAQKRADESRRLKALIRAAMERAA